MTVPDNSKLRVVYSGMMEAFLSNENGSVQWLLTHIILKYLSQLYCVCVVSNTLDVNQFVDINFEWIHEEENYPPMIWLKYETCENNQTVVDDLIRMGIDSGCQAFIAIPSAVIDFLNAYENVRYTAKNRYHLIHLVALPTNRNKTNEYVKQILNHPTVQDIPNMLIISPSTIGNETGNSSAENYFDLITSRFGTRNNSSDIRLLATYDELNGNFIENVDLFPNKMCDLEGRIVTLAMLNYKPNSIWEKVPAGLGNAKLFDSDEENELITDGTETTMVSSFCDVYNCTMAVFPADDVGEWGIIEDNYTGDGVLGAVVERRADIGVGAFYLWYHEFLFLDFSSPISRSGVTNLCPKPHRLSGWLLPVEPFSPNMWTAEFIAFIGIFIGLAIVRSVIKGGKSYFDIATYFFQAFAIVMLQTTSVTSKHLPEMILFTTALLMCLLIASTYSGALAGIMTVPKFDPPIDTTHQIVVKNIEWAITLNGDAWVYDILIATEPDLVKMVSLFTMLPDEVLASRTTTNDLCFILERLRYGHYAVGDYIDENSLEYLRLMKYDVYWGHCVAMFYKTWPFKTMFDLHALHVIESGIQKYWELTAVLEQGISKIQLGISISNNREKNGPIKLALDHVSGAFTLFGIGCFCSTLFFIIEIFWYRFKKTKAKEEDVNSKAP